MSKMNLSRLERVIGALEAARRDTETGDVATSKEVIEDALDGLYELRFSFLENIAIESDWRGGDRR